MDKDRFYTYLNDGIQGTSEEQEDLVAILEQYPYFQGARVMLSKSYYLSGHHEFDQVLQQAAIHVGDRSYLFQEHTQELLSKTIAQVEGEMEELPVETESLEEEVNTNLAEPAEPNVEHDVEQDNSLKEEERCSYPEEAIEVEEDDSLQPEEKESHNTKEDRKKFDEMNELDQEVLLGALSSSISQELQEHQENDETQSEQALNTEVEPASSPLQTKSKTSTAESEEGLSMFASWIYSRAKGMQYGEGVHEVSSSSIVASEEESAGDGSEAATSAESHEPKSKGDIIDAFIRNEPKITPRRAMDVDPPEVVAKALVQDEEWVTETLAQVYAKQGNLGKARKAYKLLALKYPEKSVYFANQIKKLGNQSNK